MIAETASSILFRLCSGVYIENKSQQTNSCLSNRTPYIAKRYSAERLAYFYGKEGWTLRNLDSNVIYISSFASMALHPGRSRSLAIPCFTKGEVCHRAVSKLANTKSASLLIASDSAIATKNEKTEISRDFSRFFDPEFFSEFHRSLLPFSMLCPDSDSRKGLNLIVSVCWEPFSLGGIPFQVNCVI